MATYKYGPWGELIGQTGTFDIPFRYAGYYFDSETGMYYLKTRYYSPELGRFLTKDSVDGANADPKTLNPYAYAEGNPVMNTDPDGHFAQVAIGAAIGAGIGFAASVARYSYEVKTGQRKFSWKTAAIAVGTGVGLGALNGVIGGALGGLGASLVERGAVMAYGFGKSMLVNSMVSKATKTIPTNKPASKSTSKSSVKPKSAPASKPRSAPASVPKSKPTSKPASKPTTGKKR
ncbi:MAG: RHS repeat-associated core domain-containing protein [Actinomycetota bacterium]|nr:RHS repeat-associated core domain-containing protein [Actinomycetota bacterium]